MASEKKVGKVYSQQELEDLARRELNEDPKRIAADVKAMKEWLKKQPHLAKTGKQDDVFILTALRGCKFSLEKTKRKIENWNTIRGMCPEFYDGWDVDEPDNKHLLSLGLNLLLPGYDKHGRKVVIQRPNLADPKKYSADDVMRVTYLTTDIMVKEADFQTEVCGLVIISDCVGATMTHMTNYTPVWGKKIATVYEEVYPARPKILHLLNLPSFMEVIFNMVKGFMTKKMQERIQVHAKGDLSKLQQELGLDVLPEEYGGTNGNLADIAAATAKEAHAHKDWLLKQTKLKSSEKKRQGVHKSYSDIFGMEGSFRQLAFD